MSVSTTTFNHEFKTEAFKGKVSFPTGVFIDGKFSAGSGGTTIDVIDPSNGKILASINEGTSKDVDDAVDCAKKAFKDTWGLKVPGEKRGRYLNKLADLMEEHLDELAAIEALNTGKTFTGTKAMDLKLSVSTLRYYAGWADKIHGQVIETQESNFAYTRREPFGIVGQIIPTNFSLLIMAWKLGPALATGNCVVLKPSEFTPLTALRMCTLINEAGFPPGVVNVVTGYGHTVGLAISEHMKIDKVAFTGSTLVGRKIMEAAAKSNLKDVTLELGGVSPNIVFDDADLDLAVDCFVRGIFWNHGQTCCAGSRIFVHSKIYGEFLKRFTQATKSLKTNSRGLLEESKQCNCPQVSKAQFDRTSQYILNAEKQFATVHLGGKGSSTQGYWIDPTIITAKSNMGFVKEEIFGPVAVIIKFENEDDVLELEDNSLYGLTASFFTKDLTRGVQVANKLQAGTVWVNCMNTLYPNVPYGGFKQSGIGRECGQYALDTYTNVKSVQMNISGRKFESPVV
ncbi:aldehyde dehydrogenase domain-containing protein [Russula vinacea]|nr:aldehyde dehydrogenase domain-containing protein [Russula vinacea]